MRRFPLLAFLFAIALLNPLKSALAAPSVLDRIEASVNSNLILLSDVRNFRKSVGLRSQLDPLFAGTPLATRGSGADDASIVQFLVDEKLILQQFPITDAEVEQEINSIQTNNHIDRTQLKNALKEQGYPFEDYFELIRVSAAKRNLIDRDIRTKVSISDDDIKNYFYNHSAKSSSVPYSYHVKIITFSAKNYKSSSAAYGVAKDALRQIRAGEAFEEVAKRVSDDPSAESGGDLGTMNEEQVSPAIRGELKKMQIGQVSEVLGTPSTQYFILKLADMRSTESDRLEKMKEEIRSQLAASEYQHQIVLWLDRQRQSSFIRKAGEGATAGLPKSAPQ